MPSPTPTVPRTHQVSINLAQILLNLQRTALYAARTSQHWLTTQQQPQTPSPPDICTITTLDALHDFLEPALDTPILFYSKRLFKKQWLHILTYKSLEEETQFIMLTPTTILSTDPDQECRIDPSLAYYLGSALDLQPPASAKNHWDADIVGYIRCFGAGNLDCPHFQDYAPPVVYLPDEVTPTTLQVPTPVDMKRVANLQRLVQKATTEKLKNLYEREIAKQLKQQR